MTDAHEPTIAACRCGATTFLLAGEPIAHIACYCTSCRTAGRAFEAAGAPPVVDADGGTDYVLYRKDRVEALSGAARLIEHRLKPDSPTRRLVAGCCNTPMALDVVKGHWLSFLRARLPAEVPPLEMRMNTADRQSTKPWPDDVPVYAGFGRRFMWRLLKSRLAMGFKTPPTRW